MKQNRIKGAVEVVIEAITNNAVEIVNAIGALFLSVLTLTELFG